MTGVVISSTLLSELKGEDVFVFNGTWICSYSRSSSNIGI